ncbi:MAG: hypothetical protein HYX68_20260 [Planctomycetes bacterium]|nr:hypothetical protein [Planctomycetota bacterium]
MSQAKECPRCRSPLEIPNPAPDRITCGKCGAVIKRKAEPAPSAVKAGPAPIAAPTRPTPQAPPAATSQGGLLIAGGIIAAVLVLGCVPVIGIGMAWMYGGRTSDPAPEKRAGQVKNDLEKLPNVDRPEKEKPVVPVKPIGPPPMPPRVRAAIDRGAEHLKRRILAGAKLSNLSDAQFRGAFTGVETGTIALAGLSLLEAGVSPKDEAVVRAQMVVRQNIARVNHIYSLGAVLFFLNRLGEANALDDGDRRLQRNLALQIIAGQRSNGLWTYNNPHLTEDQENRLLQELEAKTYRPTKPPISTSNSMTQFALLALWGSRNKVPVRQPILHAAARFHSTQWAHGTWSYARPDMPRNFQDSNTCAGLLALAMEKVLREDKEFQGQAGITDPPANRDADDQCARAFSHLSSVIGRTKNDPIAKHNYHGKIIKADSYGDYYFLWCLERVSVIYDLKTIRGKDWYGWGSDVILQHQLPDGHWQDLHGDVGDTCFAILFLTRANLARDLTERIRTRGGMKIVE